jgi:hypothetical protein
LADDIEELVGLEIEPGISGEDFTDPVVAEMLNKYRSHDAM